MLADDAARVAAGAARLLAEARGERGVAQGQVGGVEYLAGMQVSERHLGGGDQEHVAAHMVGVILELGQLARAEHGLALDHHRRPPLLEATRSVRIDEEVDERALQTGAQTAQHGEAAARKLVAALEIQDVQIGAQIPMRFGLEALRLEIARGAPAADLGVLGLVLADGRLVVGEVGRMGDQVVELALDLVAAGVELGDLVVDGAHALLGGLGLVLFALRHHLADGLGRAVALLLKRLDLGDGGTAGLIELGEERGIPRGVAILHRLGDFLLMFADITDV